MQIQPKKKPDLKGRSASYIKDKLGIDWVTDAYIDVRVILSSMKENVEARVYEEFGPLTKKEILKHVTKYTKEFGSITDVEFRKHMGRKLENIKNDPPSLKGQVLKAFVDNLCDECSFQSPLTEFIENNKRLKNTFDSFIWAPYMLARMIIATFLDVSIETVKDYIKTT